MNYLDLDEIDKMVLSTLSPYAHLNFKARIDSDGEPFTETLSINADNLIKLDGLNFGVSMQLRFNHGGHCLFMLFFDGCMYKTPEIERVLASFNDRNDYFKASITYDYSTEDYSELSLIHRATISSEEESIQLTREFLTNVNRLIGDCQLIALAKSSLKVSQNR